MKVNSTELENVFTNIQQWAKSQINTDPVLNPVIEQQLKKQKRWTLQGISNLIERCRPVKVKKLIEFDEEQMVGTSQQKALRNFFRNDELWRGAGINYYGNWEVVLDPEGERRTAIIRNLSDTEFSYIVQREDFTDEICYQLQVEQNNETSNNALHTLEGTWRLAVTENEQCPITLTRLA